MTRRAGSNHPPAPHKQQSPSQSFITSASARFSWPGHAAGRAKPTQSRSKRQSKSVSVVLRRSRSEDSLYETFSGNPAQVLPAWTYRSNWNTCNPRTHIWCEKEKGVVKAAPLELHAYAHCIALPLVSRQIYAETATMFYAENVFCFWTPSDLRMWLGQRIRAQREAIRTLYMHEKPWKQDYRLSSGVPYSGLPRLVKEVKRLCPNFEELKTDDIPERLNEERRAQ